VSPASTCRRAYGSAVAPPKLTPSRTGSDRENVPFRRNGRRDGARRLLAVSHTGLASGAEMVLVRVLAAAREEGWSVMCLCPPGAMAERLAAAGITRLPVPEMKLPAGLRAVAAVRLMLRSLRAGRRIRRASAEADVVLVNGILALPALAFARIAKPKAWLVHDVIHRPSWLVLLWIFGRSVDRAIAVSESAARPIRNARIDATVVRNGVEWPVEPAPFEKDGPPIVGCAAVLTSWKGQDVLLEAVARLPRTDVVLELVGGSFPKDGAYIEQLRERAERPDLAGRVRFLGHVPDVLSRARTWTVGVSASVDPEAGPLALLEYLSIGLPAVATAHGGSAEVLDDAGLLVPPRDPDALAAAIGRLLDEDELRRRCAASGPKVIERSNLTVESSNRRTIACLAELAARSR